MNERTITVRYQIEGEVEVSVPEGASQQEIERYARTELSQELGHLSVDITNWEVVDEG